MIEVMIEILPKKDILDPQGKAVLLALKNLGFQNTSEVRMGKLIHLSLQTASEEQALEECKKMCEELLVNPLIEFYRMEIIRP